MKVEYIIKTHEEIYPEHARELRNKYVEELTTKETAYEAGKDYFYDGGGDEDSWPLIFSIYVDGVHRVDYEVDCSTTPVFTTREVQE